MPIQLPPPKPDQVELVRELTRLLTEYEQRIMTLEQQIREMQNQQGSV